ncbi:hypothetical protein BD324DRAFT_614626 [Kockovaella imperatae]|uniref:UV radiation resistance protein and autophagy-related subunit 14-domain-containing protein n=1 Tax=Kockovaella imperatae TaxID=4999 RepID=A0A1Y1UNS1_9TREE|nr:hypothetical protein BD324DRAFT_614626 [Kockovaella imperatae]ORX39691.1 hypothetical protein BD324DRAFT_614626 [Kockovaella imperatae]
MSDELDGDVLDGPPTKPLIRHITGIRIHQLTLPESIPLASKLISDPPTENDERYTTLGESSKVHNSPEGLSSSLSLDHGESRRARRESTSTLRPSRSPSVSAHPTSPISPVQSSFRQRIPRPRSQTLAGEAIQHGHVSSSFIEVQESAMTTRRLARTFIVFRLPQTDQLDARPQARRFGSQESYKDSVTTGSSPSRARSSSSATSPLGPHARSPIPSPLSSPKLGPTIRTRIVSSPTASPSAASKDLPSMISGSRKPLSRPSVPPLNRSFSGKQIRPVSSPRSPTYSSPFPRPDVPFYISPIHHPSIHPRFVTLASEGDFAPWLTTEESGLDTFDVEVWYEDDDRGWRRANDLCRRIRLQDLRRREKQVSDPNTFEITLSSDPRGIYYLCQAPQSRSAKTKTQTIRHIVQRSLRETRMKDGVSVGGLLQLVNMQSVLADTEREIARVQARIEVLLQQDVDWRALRREIAQRETRCAWVQKASGHVDNMLQASEAHIVQRKQANDRRRSDLINAEQRSDLISGECADLQLTLDAVESERLGSFPAIHRWRMFHAQSLDALFPIQSLHPPTLLYSILDVPLPIPASPKDPAPPLSVPTSHLPAGCKVDERTTASALGYAAMVVQILGHLAGPTSGLAYPVTCVGSRSLVKDVISIMQGPRSFPLYAKGVERYRYEYAVFLLNKNIEILMQESNIRAMDVRQTLPNLKSLLLTLSSPVSNSNQTLASSMTIVNSNNSSRQTSYTFGNMTFGSPGSSVTGRESPSSSRVMFSGQSALFRGHERRSSLRPMVDLTRSLRGEDEDEDSETELVKEQGGLRQGGVAVVHS